MAEIKRDGLRRLRETSVAENEYNEDNKSLFPDSLFDDKNNYGFVKGVEDIKEFGTQIGNQSWYDTDDEVYIKKRYYVFPDGSAKIVTTKDEQEFRTAITQDQLSRDIERKWFVTEIKPSGVAKTTKINYSARPDGNVSKFISKEDEQLEEVITRDQWMNEVGSCFRKTKLDDGESVYMKIQYEGSPDETLQVVTQTREMSEETFPQGEWLPGNIYGNYGSWGGRDIGKKETE